MNEIDVRGMACPAPVLKTKETLEKEGPDWIKVIVDNDAAKQNVTRFLEFKNYSVSVKVDKDSIQVIGQRKAAQDETLSIPSKSPVSNLTAKIMVMITNNEIGHGDPELGKKLMTSFLSTLAEMGQELWRLVFLNNGVKLTISGLDILPILQGLEKNGVHILVCGTCLDHFHLLDQKQVGETTNMLDIITSMQLADKVITI